MHATARVVPYETATHDSLRGTSAGWRKNRTRRTGRRERRARTNVTPHNTIGERSHLQRVMKSLPSWSSGQQPYSTDLELERGPKVKWRRFATRNTNLVVAETQPQQPASTKHIVITT